MSVYLRGGQWRSYRCLALLSTRDWSAALALMDQLRKLKLVSKSRGVVRSRALVHFGGAGLSTNDAVITKWDCASH